MLLILINWLVLELYYQRSQNSNLNNSSYRYFNFVITQVSTINVICILHELILLIAVLFKCWYLLLQRVVHISNKIVD